MNEPITNSRSFAPGRKSFPSLERFPAHVRDFYEENRAASVRFVDEERTRAQWLLKRNFRVEASTCIDGRVLDFPQAVGTPTGVMEIYRSAGGRIDMRSHAYARRCLDGMRKAQRTVINGVEKRMLSMRFVTVHYSRSRPQDASCAAWSHDTNAALKAMGMKAAGLDQAFPGKLVAFPTLVDTDYDAITVYGPGGSLGTPELLDEGTSLNGVGFSLLTEQLRRIFPLSWEPLAKMEASYRDTFHGELAERLVANLEFVRNVIATKRPVEFIDHQERMIFVGRHADLIVKHNSIFLIDDTDTDTHVSESFEIALKYVALNVITEALETGDRDWIVPVIINVPHDDDDEDLTRIYTQSLESRLKEQLGRSAGRVAYWLQHEEHLAKVPGWLTKQLATFAEHVRFYKSVSHRSTRLFVPFE